MAHLVAACTAEPLGVRADSGPACREVSRKGPLQWLWDGHAPSASVPRAAGVIMS